MRTGEARVRPDAVPAEALARCGHGLMAAVDSGAAPATAGLLRGDPVAAERLRHELGEPAYETLRVCGLIREADGQAGSPFRGHRLGDRILFTDPDVEEDQQDPLYLDPLWEADLLSRLMLPRTGAVALDVGCGSGVLSLVLAADYQRVVAIDINPRAHEFTRLNAALNGVSTIDLVESDLYQQVDERFDRIVFNSPTNEEEKEFRNLLEAGEGILERFFTGLPAHLAPGGLAELNLAMNDYPESRFVDRLGRWLGLPGSGIDALILVSQRETRAAGREWKRGWLLATHGTGRITEVDFPYHELGEGNDRRLSDTVERFLAEAKAAAAGH